MTQAQTQPALTDDLPARRRRARWIVMACAALLLIWSLLSPLFVNRIVPPLSGQTQSVTVALVTRDDRPWLALARPDGSSVLYTFAPRTDPLPPFAAVGAFFSGAPASLLKIDFSSELPLADNVRLVSADKILLFEASQGRVYELVNRLDADFDANIASIRNTPIPGARSVDSPAEYKPLRANTNRWLASQIEELGLQVQGAQITDDWEYRPDLQ